MSSESIEKLKLVKSAMEDIYVDAQKICNESFKTKNKTLTIMSNITASYKKLQHLEIELNNQLELVRKLVSQLENKKMEVMFSFEKVEEILEMEDNIKKTFERLRVKRVDEEILKIIEQNNSFEVEDGESEDSKIEYLFDFVDYESVEDHLKKAKQAYDFISDLKKEAGIALSFLVQNIHYQITQTEKSNNEFDHYYGKLVFKQEETQKLVEELKKLNEEIANFREKFISFFSYVSLNHLTLSNPEKKKMEQDLEVELSNFERIKAQHIRMNDIKAEISNLNDDIIFLSEGYEDTYDNKRKALNEFVNFAPTVQQHMHNIDNVLRRYYTEKDTTANIFEELRKLATWYEYFEKAYDNLCTEIIRRKNYERQINKEVANFAQELTYRFEKECRERFRFEEENERYLPPDLKTLYNTPPTKFEIYPLPPSLGADAFEDSNKAESESTQDVSNKNSLNIPEEEKKQQ